MPATASKSDFTQRGRPFVLKTALEGETLLLERFTAQEGVSRLFHYVVDALSVEPNIDPKEILRKPASVEVETMSSRTGEIITQRHFHGIVNRFARGGRESQNLYRYRLEMVPWFWFLTQSSDCRIYQKVSAPEIIESLFGELGYSSMVEFKLMGRHAKREYCVQYRETHFDFISRLMEEEGIFYFFTHEADGHKLVIADHPSKVEAPKELKHAVRISPTMGNGVGMADVLTRFELDYGVHPSKVTLADFNPLVTPIKPIEASLTADKSKTKDPGNDKEEFFDYPGVFTNRAEGDGAVRRWVEEREAMNQVARGAGSVGALQAGTKLKVLDLDDVETEYQVLQAQMSGFNGAYESTGPEDRETRMEGSFVAIPADVHYRPPRLIGKPVISGLQTAIVTGPAGEEVWVDKFGRITVQFHWDRQGKKDEKSSCAVRVASTWAGKGWGFVQFPRIGQEVVIEFLHGDPDQPLVVGSVYNAEQVPPYKEGEKADANVSGLKTRSLKGGSDSTFNELRFNDKKDAELIFMRAEKDFEQHVVNDRTLTVEKGHEKHTIKKGDQTFEITEGKQTVKIKMDQSTTITDGNQINTVQKGDQTNEVKQGKQTVKINGEQNTKITTGDQVLDVAAGKQTVTIKGDQTTTLKSGSQKLEIQMGNQSTKLAMGNIDTKLDLGNVTTKLGVGNVTVKTDAGKITLEALQGIELKVGPNSIKIDLMGITIKGMMVKVNGDMMTEVKGGLMAKVEGGVMLQAKGAITMLG